MPFVTKEGLKDSLWLYIGTIIVVGASLYFSTTFYPSLSISNHISIALTFVTALMALAIYADAQTSVEHLEYFEPSLDIVIDENFSRKRQDHLPTASIVLVNASQTSFVVKDIKVASNELEVKPRTSGIFSFMGQEMEKEVIHKSVPVEANQALKMDIDIVGSKEVHEALWNLKGKDEVDVTVKGGFKESPMTVSIPLDISIEPKEFSD